MSFDTRHHGGIYLFSMFWVEGRGGEGDPPLYTYVGSVCVGVWGVSHTHSGVPAILYFKDMLEEWVIFSKHGWKG